MLMKYNRKKTGELEMFREIWKERPHKCQVSGSPLVGFDVQSFAHVITKGAYPQARLDKSNIILMTRDMHYMYDFETHKAKKDPRFKWVFELADRLRIKYNSAKGYNTF